MVATIVVLQGAQAGQKMAVGDKPVTFGRGRENDVVIGNPAASRVHAELRPEAGGYVLHDRGSSNGTFVNGSRVTAHRLRPGDEIMIGGVRFRFETPSGPTLLVDGDKPGRRAAEPAQAGVLRVLITGGGPVGLSLALLLDCLLGQRVAITMYDGRWFRDGDKVVWKTPEQGNVRRQQVVTIQSRQFLRLPPEVQHRLFAPGRYTEMWPAGPDSIENLGRATSGSPTSRTRCSPSPTRSRTRSG